MSPDSTAAPEWASAKERSNRWALRLLVWIALALGRGVARALLLPVAGYFFVTSPAARRHSARYLARALGRAPTWAERFAHMHTFATVALDRLFFARGNMQAFDLHITGGPHVDAALADGGGAFMLGVHFGSFEALSAVGSSRPGMRVAMVMYPDNARAIQGVLQAVAPEGRFSVIPIGRPGSTLEIRDWLDGGGLVGLMGDRHAPGADVRTSGVERMFLGAPAHFPDGPLRLAMLLRRRVVFMVGVFRGGHRYDVHFEALADFRERPETPAAREAQLQAAISALVARLEALCREHPMNWFNFYDFWGDDLAH